MSAAVSVTFVVSSGTGPSALGVLGGLLSSETGRSCSSTAARMASSRLRTTSGALVSSGFVVAARLGCSSPYP
jgi:hypothetical protein